MGSQNAHVPLRNARWVPQFAVDNQKLRAVIEEQARKHKHISPANFGYAKHLKAVRRAGSFEAFLAGIAYRAWRQRWDAHEIARQMGIKHASVRRWLFTMHETARKLGLENDAPFDAVDAEMRRWASR